jgi:hypothetical protein
MAFTDHPVDAYVFPQDGASSGISDFDADWQNAAYVGGLAKAQTTDYTPEGVDVTVDYANNTFDATSGLSFIEDTQDIEFRDWDDSEQVRSGLWTEGYLSVMFFEGATGIPLETTTGTNYVYLGWDRSDQNSTFIRVADTDNPPAIGVKIEAIDAGANSSAPKNRVAGYSWNFLGKHETGGFVGEADVQWPENGYDEYKVKFINVQGQGTSGGQQLHARINNVTSGYHFRTTQNNTGNSDRFKLLQGEGGEMHIAGHLYFSMDAGKWQYDNRLTSNEEKQYSFSGSNYNTSVNPLNSMQLFWGSGQSIKGEFNIWGRDRL